MIDRKVLISILGRASKKDGQYKTAKYFFPSDNHNANGNSKPTAFSGWALLEYLRPDAMLILGTSGSDWPFLLLDAVQNDSAQSEAFDKLTESFANHTVTQQQLDTFTPQLQKHLGGDVALQIVPTGRTEVEQLSLLKVVAEHIAEGDKVFLDLTHGFRHQPILLLMVAIYLRTVRSASIEKIYSSFFDETTGEAELFDLSGLLRLIDWTSALAGYEKDGDLGVFVRLLSQDRASDSSLKHLKDAAFADRTHAFETAFSKSRSFARELEQQPMQGVSGIFQDYLVKQLATKNEDSPALRLVKRAKKHLHYGDYDRVAILGEVAFLSHFAKPEENLADPKNLDLIKDEVMSAQRPTGVLWEPYNIMRRIRNTFAHVQSPDKDLRPFFRDENSLHQKLDELLNVLEKHILQKRSGVA